MAPISSDLVCNQQPPTDEKMPTRAKLGNKSSKALRMEKLRIKRKEAAKMIRKTTKMRTRSVEEQSFAMAKLVLGQKKKVKASLAREKRLLADTKYVEGLIECDEENSALHRHLMMLDGIEFVSSPSLSLITTFQDEDEEEKESSNGLFRRNSDEIGANIDLESDYEIYIAQIPDDIREVYVSADMPPDAEAKNTEKEQATKGAECAFRIRRYNRRKEAWDKHFLSLWTEQSGRLKQELKDSRMRILELKTKFAEKRDYLLTKSKLASVVREASAQKLKPKKNRSEKISLELQTPEYTSEITSNIDHTLSEELDTFHQSKMVKLDSAKNDKRNKRKNEFPAPRATKNIHKPFRNYCLDELTSTDPKTDKPDTGKPKKVSKDVRITPSSQISRICDKLPIISKEVADKAVALFDQVRCWEKVEGVPLWENIRAPRNHVALVTSCLYFECGRNHVPVTIREILEASSSTQLRKSVNRSWRAILTKFGKSVVATAEDFVSRFCKGLDLPDAVESAAKEIARNAHKLDLVAGRIPTWVASAAIYMASQASREKRSRRKIASVVGLTDQTIIKSYELMIPYAAQLFPKDFRFFTAIKDLPER